MNSKYRKVSFSWDAECVLICERTSLLVPGYSNRRWTEERVAMTVDELEKALEYGKRWQAEKGGGK